MSATREPLLRVRHLHTQFSTEAGLVRAVEDLQRHRVVGRDPRREQRCQRDDREDRRPREHDPAPEQLGEHGGPHRVSR